MRHSWRIWSYFRPDGLRILLSIGLLALSTAAGLLKPWPLALIVDSVLGGKPLPEWLRPWIGTASPAGTLTRLVLLMAALHGAHALLVSLQNGTVILLGLRGLERIRAAVFDWLLGLSMKQWNGLPQGEILYRATWDAYSIQTLFTQGLFGILGATTQVLAMTWVMVQLNLSLTATALITVPILVLVMRQFGGTMSRLAGQAQLAETTLATRLQQTVANLLLIQSFTREPEETEQFRVGLEQSKESRWRQHRAELAYLVVVALVLGSGSSGLVYVGARQVVSGALTVGGLWVFLAYLAQLYEPLNQLSQLGTTLTNALAGTRRVIDLMENQAVEVDGNRPFQAEAGRLPAIRFEAVSFSYDGRRAALDEVNLAINPGEVVALIGPSGAGKTTLLQMIPRFLDPTSGVIRMDGVAIPEFERRSLRLGISVLLQEPLLLPTSIAENLAYGNLQSTREQIIEAAKLANADDFIRRLPKGYDTIVGDGAARLSVGEKQRLNLARAFLKNAPVLLLDEPTSALDVESESLVLDGLRLLTKKRTTIMVAHRLETLRIADRIIELRNGRIGSIYRTEDWFNSRRHSVQ